MTNAGGGVMLVSAGCRLFDWWRREDLPQVCSEFLLPEQTYWVTITSYEYGTIVSNIAPAESNIVSAAKTAVPLADPLCCEGTVGDVNCDGEPMTTIGDVALLLDHLFINQAPLCCVAEADVNQSGGSDPRLEDISLGDVAMLIDYLYITGESLGLPDCM